MTTPASLRAEFTLQRKKLLSNPGADLHKELAYNIYPCLEALAEQLQEQDRALQAFEESDSYILPDLAEVLLTAFLSVDSLITEIRKIEIDDLNRKKISDLANEAEKLCAEAAMAVNDAAVEEADEEDEDTEDEEAEDEEAEKESDDQAEKG